MELTSALVVLRAMSLTRLVTYDVKLHCSCFHDNYKSSADFKEADLDDESGSFHRALKVVVSNHRALPVAAKLLQRSAFYETGGFPKYYDENQVEKKRQSPDCAGCVNHRNQSVLSNLISFLLDALYFLRTFLTLKEL